MSFYLWRIEALLKLSKIPKHIAHDNCYSLMFLQIIERLESKMRDCTISQFYPFKPPFNVFLLSVGKRDTDLRGKVDAKKAG